VSQSSSCEIHESEVREQAHDASFVLLWIFDRVLPIDAAEPRDEPEAEAKTTPPRAPASAA
jgi:hypothetical protein